MGLSGGGLEGLTSGSGGGAGGGSAIAGLGIWRFRTETSAPPNSGQVRFNNTVIESATEMYLHEINADGTDMENFLAQLGVGSFLYIQERSDSENFILVQISSNTDSGAYRTFGIDQVEAQGDKPSQNSETAIVATGDPSPAPAATVFPQFAFGADDFLEPDSADWEFTPAALAADDTNNSAIRVRLFDDTVDEAVGWQIFTPVGATSLTVHFIGRAETAPAGARVVNLQLATRDIPDNAIPKSPWSQAQMTNLDIPANEFFQYDSQTFTLAFFGLVAGELQQWQIKRRNPTSGTDLTGDWALAQIRMTFS